MLIFEERKRVDFEADGISDIMRALLGSRGIASADQAAAFLSPSLDQLCDPFSIFGMTDAVSRIEKAFASRERIMIYGDYDVDGVTATATLVSYFRSVGADVEYYIPSRHEEGYGLNSEAVLRIAKTADLCVTVDCGITSVSEAALAKSLGLSLIITDHHKPSAELPECEAIVSAVLGGSFDKFAGVGIAAMLVYALGGTDALLRVIDLAAMGTVADIVPLIGDNRVLTAVGISRMNEYLRPGIAALAATIKSQDKEITSSHIAYFISPRINAGGRMGRSNRSVELLLTDDDGIAADIAESLNSENSVRQEVEARILDEVETLIRERIDFIRDRAIIVKGRWNQGVVGLVASRIVDRYHMPTILLCELDGDKDEDGTAVDTLCAADAGSVETFEEDSGKEHSVILTGSARSIPGINLHAMLTPFSELFMRFGGHEQAAGITMEGKYFEEFSDGFNAALRDSVPPEVYVPRSVYDLAVSVKRLTPRLVNDLASLQPTGYGNPSPVFLAKQVDIINPRRVGAQQAHVKLTLGEDDTFVDAIAFKMGHIAERMSGQMDVLFSPGLNVWNGKVSVQCEVRAVRPCYRLSGFAESCGALAEERLTENFAERIGTGYRDAEAEVITDDMEADELIGRAIEEIRGNLLIAYTPEAVGEVARKLLSADRGEYVGLYAGHMEREVHAFSALCYAPLWREDSAEFKKVICLDGDWGEVSRITGIYPKARVTVIATQSAKERAKPWARRLLPSKDALRALYVAARNYGDRPVRVRDIRELCGFFRLDVLRLVSGLCVLAELGLIEYKKDGEYIELRALKSRKCDPSDSGLYMKLSGLADE